MARPLRYSNQAKATHDISARPVRWNVSGAREAERLAGWRDGRVMSNSDVLTECRHMLRPGS